ncbi:MAG TPA: hypothetical protein PLC15_25595, partial [Candidatus Obscuribacter sp.]|nr:hypothetical protein [Candidatus Obscuribacter sp.]
PMSGKWPFLLTSLFLQAAPDLVLWSWDYPQDLSFLKNEKTRVAYYAGTATLRGQRVFFQSATKTLKIPDNIETFPVLRIETKAAALTPEQSQAVSDIALKILHRNKAEHIQIDFDAAQDERPFYLTLLQELRRRLDELQKQEKHQQEQPKQRLASSNRTTIGITSLASWSTDNWLPIEICDERVTMLFSLGKLGKSDLETFTRQKPQTIGIGTWEEAVNRRLKELGTLKTARTIYLFNAHPWTKESFDHAKEILRNN